MILYKLLKNTNEEMGKAFGKYYAYPVITRTVGIPELAKQMAAYNTGFSEGQVKGMLADLVKCVRENVLNGFAVKIDDLAIFTCGIINKEGADQKAQFTVTGNIESIKLRARSTGELTRANLNKEASLMDIEKLAKLKFDDVTDPTPSTPSDNDKGGTSQGGNTGSDTGGTGSDTGGSGSSTGGSTSGGSGSEGGNQDGFD